MTSLPWGGAGANGVTDEYRIPGDDEVVSTTPGSEALESGVAPGERVWSSGVTGCFGLSTTSDSCKSAPRNKLQATPSLVSPAEALDHPSASSADLLQSG